MIITGETERPEAVAVVLHGGRGRAAPVRPTALSALRMVPIATRIGHVGRGRLAVVRVLNSQQGWNPADHSPLADLRWTLDQVRDRFGRDTPVGLVGHSLGGSAALAGAGDPSVRSVVALAPWLSGQESTAPLAGRQVLIVHGSVDRVTSPTRSAAFARAAAGVAASISFVDVAGGEHTMMRHLNTFDGLAAGFVCATLLPPDPDPATADSAALTELLSRALQGESPLAA